MKKFIPTLHEIATIHIQDNTDSVAWTIRQLLFALSGGANLAHFQCLSARPRRDDRRRHGAMPWETPLQTIADSITGPVAKAIGVIAIAVTGLGFRLLRRRVGAAQRARHRLWARHRVHRLNVPHHLLHCDRRGCVLIAGTAGRI